MNIPKIGHLMFYVVIFINIAIPLSAVQLQITQDQKIETSQIDENAIKSYFKDVLGFVISDKGAEKLVKENRILSDEYLRKYSLNDFEYARARVMVEDYLSKLLIDKFQNKINLDDKVLLSYYYDNLEKFKESDKVDIIGYEFDSYDKALDFYYTIKKAHTPLSQAVQKFSPDIKNYPAQKLSSINYKVKRLIKKNASSYFLPPLFLGEKVKVLYIKKYYPAEGYIPFQKVRNKIKKILFDETFLKYRNQLIQQYMKNN